MTYKDDARSAQASKAKRMIGSETDRAPKIAADEGSQVSRADQTKKLARACGGRVSGGAPAKRLDKPARARGGGVETSGGKSMNTLSRRSQSLKRELDDAWGDYDPNKAAGSAFVGNKKVFSQDAGGLNKKVRRARGGAVKGKGKTIVNVIVSPQGGPGAGAGQAMALPPAPSPLAPSMPPGGGVSPAPPPGGPGMPPRPPGAGSPVPPIAMRARGGKVKAGAGSGLGRLEKAGL